MSFKKFLTIYSIVLAVLMVCFLIYVADSLVKYENYQIDNYMQNFIDDLKDADESLAINGLSDVKKGEFDKADASVIKGLAFLAENDSLTFKQSAESKDADNPVFDIYDGDNALLRVALSKKESTTRLGLLSFNIWDVKDVKLISNEGLFSTEITVPKYCNVEVNGKKLTEKEYIDSTKFAGLEDLGKQVKLAFNVTYLVKGLTDAPEIKITDKDGKPVEFALKGVKIAIDAPCEKVADMAAAKGKVKNFPDVQNIARQWSLYLTNDVKGTKNGYDVIKQYLVEGTYQCQYAYNWAVGVDKTFTSAHGFEKEMFSNEKVCNFEIYSDKEFSCDVYLQKNMRVKGQPLPDKMSERMHFVYYDDTDDGTNNPTWKLLSMKSITAK